MSIETSPNPAPLRPGPIHGHLNERQRKVIRHMFDVGADSFTGGMNARTSIAPTGTSKATATRDLQRLAALGALVPTGGGRSTRYELGIGLIRRAPRTWIFRSGD